MSPTVGFELVVAGAGIVIAMLAEGLHSGDVAVAGIAIVVLATYAVWLDWQRQPPSR